jgi:hypothetical protein
LNWTRFTILLLIALFAMNVYRAATQSVAIDEAFTYNLFLAGPVDDLFTKYDANHHILNSLLSKLSIRLLGLSEFTLRLPSLLGGLLYLITSLWLCRRLFGQGWALLVSFSLLTMSPGMLDYFSAARGYGLALAFLLLAIWQMVNYDAGSGRLERAALCLAASVAANIPFVFAGIPLAAIFALELVHENRRDEAIDRFLVPGLVVAFSIMILPLTRAGPEHFYTGMPNLRSSLESVMEIFLFHDLGGLILSPISLALIPLARWMIPVVLVVAIAACARRQPFRERSTADRVLLLATASLAGSIALLIIGNRFFGILYPVRRTGIYWIPLLVLICLTLAAKAPRAAVPPCVAVGLACVAQFVGQLNVHHYAEWPYDFDTKRVVRLIVQDHARRPGTVTIGASWNAEASLNFYRRRYRLHWMRPVERSASVPKGDYYLLQGADRALVEKLGLVKLYENQSAMLVLAVPSPKRQRGD